MTVLFYRRFNLIWSTLHSVREILFTLLGQLDVDKELIDNTGLVSTEYLTNLIRHSDGEDQAVTLVIGRTKKNIRIEFIDPTNYFHPTLSSDKQTDLEDGTLRQGGMGLALIKHYFPDFQYFSEDEKNHFYFDLTLKPVRNRIVIIDDELASLKLIEAYLKQQYECQVFQNEHDAYDYMVGHNVDLLLIDMHLNEMFADEFLSQLKKHSHLSELGIIVISADSTRENMTRAHLSGVDDYLVKPVSKSQLEMVCERVKNRSVSRAVSQPDNSEMSNFTVQLDALKVHPFGSITTATGGDLFIHKTFENADFLLMADVMGHGESANRIALQLNGFLLGLLEQDYDGLESFGNRLAEQLSKQPFMAQNIVTMILIEISGRDLNYVNFAHPIPLIYSSKNGISKLGASQPLIGLSATHQYASDYYRLAEDESVLIATDGLFENLGDMTELAQLFNALSSQLDDLSELSPHEIWQKSLPRLSKAIDDSSLLVLN